MRGSIAVLMLSLLGCDPSPEPPVDAPEPSPVAPRPSAEPSARPDEPPAPMALGDTNERDFEVTARIEGPSPRWVNLFVSGCASPGTISGCVSARPGECAQRRSVAVDGEELARRVGLVAGARCTSGGGVGVRVEGGGSGTSVHSAGSLFEAGAPGGCARGHAFARWVATSFEPSLGGHTESAAVSGASSSGSPSSADPPTPGTSGR